MVSLTGPTNVDLNVESAKDVLNELSVYHVYMSFTFGMFRPPHILKRKTHVLKKKTHVL